ncbi:hypothetical protein [Desulfosarcina cetonica]|uniref:hypothetical protein n=1 Tax=Desulfosarcina cetonica TaxID=90730 RepID=UPI0012EE02DE|nr:hypothetical protein [Desulfosarcina cetonica]
MDENKRKQIEAKLMQLFTQVSQDQGAAASEKTTPQWSKSFVAGKVNPISRSPET